MTYEIEDQLIDTCKQKTSDLHIPVYSPPIHQIIDVFPPHRQSRIHQKLASVLEADKSRGLMLREDKSGRMVATEILLNRPYLCQAGEW